MLERLVALAISAYQGCVSPYKGFRCAHRVAHGGVSCSEYVKRTVLRRGLRHSLPAVRRRFRRCRTAARRLRAARLDATDDADHPPEEPAEPAARGKSEENEEKPTLLDWLCAAAPCDAGCDAIDCCDVP